LSPGIGCDRGSSFCTATLSFPSFCCCYGIDGDEGADDGVIGTEGVDSGLVAVVLAAVLVSLSSFTGDKEEETPLLSLFCCSSTTTADEDTGL
jgi:hypothetical protein